MVLVSMADGSARAKSIFVRKMLLLAHIVNLATKSKTNAKYTI
ncbi:hypothetical protein [Desulfovibrio desulfuricans]|nr:hypothetical protein [Desulfovibrio desulfuricans]